METLEVTITGTLPLLMHNGQLADPLNKWAKAISEVASIRKKTEEQILEMRRLEWFGSLYIDGKDKISMPGENLFRCLVEGAKKTKHGEATKRGVFVTDEFFPMTYDGSKDPEVLWKDKRFVDMRAVKLNRSSSVIRTRPIFRQWSIDFALFIETDEIDVVHVVDALRYAGERKALGDYRPQFGRFSVEVS